MLNDISQISAAQISLAGGLIVPSYVKAFHSHSPQLVTLKVLCAVHDPSGFLGARKPSNDPVIPGRVYEVLADHKFSQFDDLLR
jgi:hypothetical protein